MVVRTGNRTQNLVLPLLAIYGNVGKNGNPYPATNFDIVLFCQFIPYPSSKFSSHSSSCITLVDGVWHFTNSFHFCHSLVLLAILRGRHFADERNGALKKLKDVFKTSLVNASGGGKTFVFLFQVQCSFPLHSTLLSQRKKRLTLALPLWLPYSRVDVRLILQ